MPMSLRTAPAITLALCFAVGVDLPPSFAAETPSRSPAVPEPEATVASAAQDPNNAPGGGPAPRAPGASDGDAAALPQAASPAPRSKEPRKEASDPRKKRFLRTPAGVMLLIVVGALVVGGASQAVLDSGNSP